MDENNHERARVQTSNLVNLIEEGEVMSSICTHKVISGWAENGLLLIKNSHENSNEQNRNIANLIEEREVMGSIPTHIVISR